MAFDAYIRAICFFRQREVETLKEEGNLRSFYRVAASVVREVLRGRKVRH